MAISLRALSYYCIQFQVSTVSPHCGAQQAMKLVIFDCDGVLIDSEALCDRVVVTRLAEDGWALTLAECHRRFVGLTFSDIQVAAEAWLGRALGDGWLPDVVARVTAAMAAEVEPIPGAREALLGVAALGLPYRIASNSSREEMAAKFARTGLLPLVEGRIHSADDLIAQGKRGKPDPDLFLEAAAAGGVEPADCLVIEDSLPGIRAAVTAGMRCWAYCPPRDGAGDGTGDGAGNGAGDGAALRHAGVLARELRASGASIEVGGAAKLKRAMEIANKVGARRVLIIGDEELAAHEYSLKDMRSGEQERVSRAELAGRLN